MHLPTGKDVEVKIPAGLTGGQQIRLKGQGWPSATAKAGDALITVNVAPRALPSLPKWAWGAMIAFAGALRLAQQQGKKDYRFNVKPRWDLSNI